MALQQKQLPVAFPRLSMLTLYGCDPLASASHLPPQSAYQEIYRIFPCLHALFIKQCTFTPQHERNGHLSLLTAFASDDPNSLWPHNQPLKILHLQCPPLGYGRTFYNLPNFPATLEIIRITSLPAKNFTTNRFLHHLTSSIPSLPALRYLHLPEMFRQYEITDLLEACKKPNVQIIFATGLERGKEGYENLAEIFWDDVEMLKLTRVRM